MADKVFSDSFTFLPQGGIIQEFKIAGTDVVLGFPSAESYRSEHTPFFGENIGRVANRISGAKINNLNGKSYDLTANEGRNTLHGGAAGWGKQNFEGPTPVNRNGKESVLFKYLSKDGEEGFPGTVELRLWYLPSIETVDGVEKTSLEIEYEVELVGDEVEETVVAVTNHRYASVLSSQLTSDLADDS
jgi:aldose 1-epimerase